MKRPSFINQREATARLKFCSRAVSIGLGLMLCLAIVAAGYGGMEVRRRGLPLPGTGAARLPQPALPSSQNGLFSGYVGPDFQCAQTLKVQYKLEGVDTDWSAPTEQRTVNNARLAPGSYRLLVRAINQDGATSPELAVLELRILPPLWRWWFLVLLGVVLTAGAFALLRLRVRQIIALERIRRRIATDLHDEIGSGLAQIAILSEVAKREAAPAATGLLNETANLARAMRDSMSDIVWSVDPHKDRLADLAHRMRQATFNLLEAGGLRVEFQVPAEQEIERINLTPDCRRQLLLIFKEALTNIARHGRATLVRVEMALTAGELQLVIRDNGRGFDPQARCDGHGLHGIKQRAAELAANLEIISAPGHGTALQMTLPLKKRRVVANSHAVE